MYNKYTYLWFTLREGLINDNNERAVVTAEIIQNENVVDTFKYHTER